MIDILLFAARVVLVIFLYIFLYVTMKTGIGLVQGQRKDGGIWTITVEKGPRALRNLHVDILGPTVVGRSPSCDIVIDQSFVSGTHAQFTLQGPSLVIEDLQSTNGTLVNGHPIDQPVTLRDEDDVQIGDAIMHISRR